MAGSVVQPLHYHVPLRSNFSWVLSVLCSCTERVAVGSSAQPGFVGRCLRLRLFLCLRLRHRHFLCLRQGPFYWAVG